MPVRLAVGPRRCRWAGTLLGPPGPAWYRLYCCTLPLLTHPLPPLWPSPSPSPDSLPLIQLAAVPACTACVLPAVPPPSTSAWRPRRHACLPSRLQAGVAPPVVLEATHEKTLQHVGLDTLQRYAA